MKQKQIAKITIVSLFIVMALLLFDNSMTPSSLLNLNAKQQPRRVLLDQSQIAQVCDKAPKTLQEFYKSGDKKLDYEVKEKSSSVDPLLKFAETQEFNELLGYIPRVIPPLFFIVMIVVTIIGWFVCCSCCCCPCGCCKQKKEEGCCRKCSFIFTIVMYGGIIAGCIAAFLYSTKFLEGVNGTTCSLMKLIDEVTEGESIDTTPKWIGIKGISETLDKTIDAIEVIQKNAQNAYNVDVIANGKSNFESELETQFNKYKEEATIPDPTPGATLPIKPEYIKKYGPFSESGQTLYIINTEYTAKIDNGVAKINTIKGYTNEISTSGTQITDSLKSSKDMLNDLSSTFEDKAGSIIDSVVLYLGYINDYANIAFYALFGVLLGLAVIALTIMIVFVCNCCPCLKCLLHFIWHLLAFLSIFTFLIGSIFVLIGIIGEDGTVVLNYVFSEENLKKETPILLPKDETLNTCLFGDGDLSKIFDLSGDSNPANNLDSLYKASSEIKNAKKLIEENGRCESIVTINEKYNEIKNNFMLAATEVNTAFIELNKYTNAGAPASYQVSISESTYDLWVSNKDNCQDGYPYSSTLNDKNRKCLLITDWETKSKYKDRYNGLTENGSFNSIKEAADHYIQKLFLIESENTELITNLLISNNAIKAEFEKQVGEMKTALTNVEGVIDPMINIFGDLVGDNSIFSIVNCKFIQNNLKAFFKSFGYDLGTTSLIFGAIILAVSCCAIFSILFVLIVINRYKKIDKQPEPVAPNDTIAVNVPNNDPLNNSSNAAAIENQELPVTVIDKIDL